MSGNILLKATLHQPYISKTLSPATKQEYWVHSVIFEPQLKMLLTRSTYNNFILRFSAIPPKF